MHAHVTHRGALLPAGARDDSDANGRLIDWINSNCVDLGQRLTIIPRRNTPLNANPTLQRFSSRGVVDIARNRPHSPGGPVLSAWPTISDMAQAIQATPRDQTLVCLEWSESFEGWASAVGAYNAATDEIEAALDDELVKDFEYLLMWDTEILGGTKRGRGRERIHPTIRGLKDAGLSEQFVATFALGLGASSGVAEHLLLHYREV